MKNKGFIRIDVMLWIAVIGFVLLGLTLFTKLSSWVIGG